MDSIDFSKINSLDELFDVWRDAHEQEDETSLLNTKHKDVLKESFCVDGFIDVKGKKCDTLYILKERMLAKLKGNERPPYNGNNEFWGKALLEGRALEKLEKISIRKLAHMQTEVFKSDVNKMAFMNINKRGGASSTNDKLLSNYMLKYKDFITKEIELLNPKRIVCCGRISDTWLAEKVKEIIPENLNIVLYKAYHPSHLRSLEHYEKGQSPCEICEGSTFTPFGETGNNN